jgi:peptide chain release factor 1
MLRGKLWEQEEMKKAASMADARSVIGRGMRAEKIRTYNYPQNRVTDHRINKSWHNLEDIMAGKLQKVTETLQTQL